MDGPGSELAGLHHVAFTVSDLDTSIGFYRDVLGLDVMFKEEAPDRRACVLRFPGAGAQLVGLVEHVGSRDTGFDPRRRGLDHAAFTVASRDHLERWATHLTAAGIGNSGAIDGPIGAILNFKDPDGVALALFWDKPE